MPKLSTLKSLGSLFCSSINSTPAPTISAAAAAAAKTPPAVNKSLKHFVSSLDASSASTFKRTLVKSQKRPQPSKPPSPAHFSSLVSIRVYTSYCSDYEDPTMQLSHYISSILSDGLSVDLLDSEGDNGKPSEDPLSEEDALSEEGALSEEEALQEEMFDDAFDDSFKEPKISDLVYFCTSLQRNLSPLERKLRCVFKKEQVNNVSHFVDSCVVRLGIDAALNLFGILGREISMKEFNALLKSWIENAYTTDDETVALEQVSKAFKVFKSMKEQGFPIEEKSYSQVLFYFIDRGMVEQFQLFTGLIKDGSAIIHTRLDYYEMLLYAKVYYEENIEEFCNKRAVVDGGDC